MKRTSAARPAVFAGIFARSFSSLRLPASAFAVLLLATACVQADVTYLAIDLGTVGGGSESAATDINNSGQAVGYSTTAGDNIHPHATLFSGTGSGNIDLAIEADTTESTARGINDSGQIVGTIYTGHSSHATLFSGTGLGNINLGTLGGTFSDANAINNSGQIVGNSYTANNATIRATLFSGTGMGNTDLGILPGSDNIHVYGGNEGGVL
jgi:probable HAF family extracellular repeat protein